MANKKQIEEIVAKMSAAFPNWNVTAFTVQVYFEDLQDLDGEMLLIAADHCRTEAGRKFAPSTGELRGAYLEIFKSINRVPSSYEAWQEVCSAIITFGRDNEPKWSNPLIEKTVRALGWLKLCMSEDAISDRSRFVAAYDQFRERAEREAIMLPQVRGFIEARGGQLLPAPADQIKMLTDKFSVTKGEK